MTRTYAALQLLAHGPLSRSEFVAITGWSVSGCAWLLNRLIAEGRLTRPLPGVYALMALEAVAA